MRQFGKFLMAVLATGQPWEQERTRWQAFCGPRSGRKKKWR
jgi:hypothetical protein